MINSFEEFMALANNPDPQLRCRLREDAATTEVWLMILERVPDLAGLVAMNKALPVEVLAGSSHMGTPERGTWWP